MEPGQRYFGFQQEAYHLTSEEFRAQLWASTPCNTTYNNGGLAFVLAGMSIAEASTPSIAEESRSIPKELTPKDTKSDMLS